MYKEVNFTEKELRYIWERFGFVYKPSDRETTEEDFEDFMERKRSRYAGDPTTPVGDWNGKISDWIRDVVKDYNKKESRIRKGLEKVKADGQNFIR